MKINEFIEDPIMTTRGKSMIEPLIPSKEEEQNKITIK